MICRCTASLVFYEAQLEKTKEQKQKTKTVKQESSFAFLFLPPAPTRDRGRGWGIDLRSIIIFQMMLKKIFIFKKIFYIILRWWQSTSLIVTSPKVKLLDDLNHLTIINLKIDDNHLSPIDDKIYILLYINFGWEGTISGDIDNNVGSKNWEPTIFHQLTVDEKRLKPYPTVG